MLIKLITTHWAELVIVLLAISFNMYTIEAEKGRYTMGLFVHKYKAPIEALNWLLLIGLVIRLSYLYSWYLIITLFVIPIVGASVASCFKSLTQAIYLSLMPIFLTVFIVKLVA